jgi:hypothetical protein
MSIEGKFTKQLADMVEKSGLDMVLPVGELPADFLRKLSYGEKITMGDRLKAGAGLL